MLITKENQRPMIARSPPGARSANRRTVSTTRFALLMSMCTLSIVFTTNARAAEDYPQRVVRIISPAAAGGTTDLLARVLAARLGEQWGRTVIVENRSGAGGVIGTQAVAQAAPDGHTLGVVFTQHTVNASLIARLPYDPIADFTPITQLTAAPLVLTVPASSSARSVADLIAMSKQRPLNYGSAGHGSGGHLSGELFRYSANIAATHIPYKGAGPAAADLLNGTLDFQFASQITVHGFLRDNRVRALAVTSLTRATSLADVPTMQEAGLRDFEVLNWFGVVAPARMPPALVDRIHRDIIRALGFSDVREKLTSEGSNIIGSTPAAFAAFLRSDLARWAKLARVTGMKAD